MKRAIIIMAKVPLAGTVKTRLQPFLTPDKCAELATAFLQDAENKVKTVCENTILAYSPADNLNILENILETKNTYIAQTGENIGERMLNAFKFAFAQNSDGVVIIGTDSPTFPADFIRQAFEYLETSADLVLGKTVDGGFYLIGLRKLVPNLFENIAWSTSSVFEQTVTNAVELGLKKKLLPEWYDIDTPADLCVLRDKILADKEIQMCTPATCQWLLSNLELFD
jgi:rSAM/selenodomain-associated transferase 1